ncbi:MAG: 6-phosphofructokinase [Holophagales bacterium]|nr:6-phosphofructokinase [Holophagales bacterium]
MVLIPEIPCDLKVVASRLKDKVSLRRPYGLVVVAEGARILETAKAQVKPSSLKASLSPLATGDASDHVIHRSGQAAETVANGLQLLLAQETYPLVLGPWVRGGTPTAVDRQLGLGYGAGAVRALKAGKNGTMVAFVPPDMKFVPLTDAINKVRTVPADSEFMQIAQNLGICLGKEL